jgi:hypothetical protein
VSGITELAAGLTDALQYVAPLSLGKRYDGQNVSPPEYLLFPLTESIGGAVQGKSATSNARSLGTRRVTLEVHCWGTDYGSAEVLRQAFVTALRVVSAGANYSLGAAQWVDPLNREYGATIVQQFEVAMPLVSATFSIAPATPVADGNSTTVTVLTAGFDTSGAVAGDRLLDAGEG